MTGTPPIRSSSSVRALIRRLERRGFSTEAKFFGNDEFFVVKFLGNEVASVSVGLDRKGKCCPVFVRSFVSGLVPRQASSVRDWSADSHRGKRRPSMARFASIVAKRLMSDVRAVSMGVADFVHTE